MLLHSSGLPSEQFHCMVEHARRLFHLTMADHDPMKSKHEAYYRSQPDAKTLLHRFGAQVIIKIRPTPPGLQPRGLRGRWYGLAGNSNTVHLVSVQYLTKGGALKHRVVRSRDVRFLDDATEPDDEFDAASVEQRPSKAGNYLGLTITITATSREQLDAIYRELTSHPSVKLVL